jgi:hypothetical protein
MHGRRASWQLADIESSEKQEALLPKYRAVTQSSSSTRGRDRLAHKFENAADRPDRRPRYGSDMNDSEWALVRDLLPIPG